MSTAQREWFEKNYYSVLGVSETATPKEVTKAYRKLARQLHPDANPGDKAAEERFKEVSAAYEVIGDPEKREQYDEVRRLGPMAGGPGGPGGFGGFGGEGQGVRFDAGDLSDLIGNLFTRGRAGAPQSAPSGPRRGTDIEATLTCRSRTPPTAPPPPSTSCPTCAARTASAAARPPAPPPGPVPTAVGAAPSTRTRASSPSADPVRPAVAGAGSSRRPAPPAPGWGRSAGPARSRSASPRGCATASASGSRGAGGAGANGGPDGDLYVQVQVEPHPLFGRGRRQPHRHGPHDLPGGRARGGRGRAHPGG